MDITPRKRSKIVALSQHTQMTQRQIASECSVGLGTVNDIIKRFRETGSFSPKRKGKCGRKKKTTPTQDRLLVRKSKINPRMTAVDLNRDLRASGTSVSDMTVRRRLLAAGRVAIKPKKKQLLTKAMMSKRLQWAKNHKDWTIEMWKNVIFSDETHFFVQGEKVPYVRKSADEKLSPAHLQQAPKYPHKKMFWGYFTHEGTGALVPVEGMMKSDQYMDICQRRIVPLMQRNPDLIFQQDLAPCHTSKKMKAFFKNQHIEVLSWPGNSPDLNPIENLWAILKKKLGKMDCCRKDELIKSVIQVWFHDEDIKNHCSTLVESMPKRVNELIKNKGGHINY